VWRRYLGEVETFYRTLWLIYPRHCTQFLSKSVKYCGSYDKKNFGVFFMPQSVSPLKHKLGETVHPKKRVLNICNLIYPLSQLEIRTQCTVSSSICFQQLGPWSCCDLHLCSFDIKTWSVHPCPKMDQCWKWLENFHDQKIRKAFSAFWDAQKRHFFTFCLKSLLSSFSVTLISYKSANILAIWQCFNVFLAKESK